MLQNTEQNMSIIFGLIQLKIIHALSIWDEIQM